MALRFAILGSGSAGNGLIVEVTAQRLATRTATRILVDCGFTVRETERRLARLELTPQDIDAIVVTHEHDDHVGGAFKFARRHAIPIWSTAGTLRGCQTYLDVTAQIHLFSSHTSFSIGEVLLQPYIVPHDAHEPTQFVFSDGQHSLGLLTDAGKSTTHILASLKKVNALVLECNHDIDMLVNSNYPYSLKQRIKGEYGHLSNQDAAEILSSLECNALQHVVAAHLSQSNNTPECARLTLAQVLGVKPQEIDVACQYSGLDWRSIN